MGLVDLLITRLQMSDEALMKLGLKTDYKRPVLRQLSYHLDLVLQRKISNQWLILTGLRGVGKTTLLGQLYNCPSLQDQQVKKVYFSFDELSKFPNATINDFIEAVDHLKEIDSEKILILLLDEVHYLSDWQTGCKLLFDRTRPLFLVCTGSSALNLSTAGADVARRSVQIKINPISLMESCQMQNRSGSLLSQAQIENLGLGIQKALFQSKQAVDVYKLMLNLEPDIKKCLKSIIQIFNLNNITAAKAYSKIIQTYINNYYSLPFIIPHLETKQNLLINQDSFQLDTRTDYLIRTNILKTLQQSTTVDAHKIKSKPNQYLINRYSRLPIDKLFELLLHLANHDQTALSKLHKKFEKINYSTFKKMIEILKASGIIYEIRPRNSNFAKTTKTSKYLFATPAIRQALLYLEPTENHRRIKGQLLEDTVVMYLQNYLGDVPYPALTYDSRSGGADFVFQPGLNKSSVVIEVGYTKKDGRQVSQTLKQDDLYGLVISQNNSLKVEIRKRVVYVPLIYFLLI